MCLRAFALLCFLSKYNHMNGFNCFFAKALVICINEFLLFRGELSDRMFGFVRESRTVVFRFGEGDGAVKFVEYPGRLF